MALNILSVDGGGIRGIVPALVLAEIEERAGRPLAELFGLIAGTSTGGIIAAALALPGEGGGSRYRARELVDLYVDEGPRIFSRSLGRRLVTGFGLIDEKYDDHALNDALHAYLGDTPLSAARTRVLITAYELETREPWFFKSWRAVEDPSRDVLLWQAARATSAAPTYFEPLRLRPPGGGDPLSLVDGGVFATNPAMCAYAEAARIEPGERLRIVSLGTGRLTRPIRHEDAAGWGLIEWVRPVIDIVFDGVARTVDYQLEQLCGPDRYHRFQVRLTGGASDALDDAGAENLRALADRASELVAERSDDLDQLAETLVAEADGPS